MPTLKKLRFSGRVTQCSIRDNYVTYSSSSATTSPTGASNSPGGNSQTTNTTGSSHDVLVSTSYSLVVKLDDDSAKALDQQSASVSLTSVSKTETLDGEIVDIEALQKLSGEFYALKVHCKARDLTLEANLPVEEIRPIQSWWLYPWAAIACVTGIWGLGLIGGKQIEGNEFLAIGLGVGFLISASAVFYLRSDYRDKITMWEQFVSVDQ